MNALLLALLLGSTDCSLCEQVAPNLNVVEASVEASERPHGLASRKPARRAVVALVKAKPVRAVAKAVLKVRPVRAVGRLIAKVKPVRRVLNKLVCRGR